MEKLSIISEIGINHNGDFRRIEEMIRQSSSAGADYAKFQLYSSKRVFGDDSRKQNEFTFEQVERIKNVCDFYNIEFFASVFDEEKIEWCEQLGVDRYKIASRTVVVEPELCNKIIALGKPTYVSLGFWKEKKLPFGEENVKYFNCISEYPTSCLSYKDFEYSDRVVGFSDHSYGIAYSLYNISKGAKIIEKHFTLNKGMVGNDHIGSMNSAELRQLSKYGKEIAKISESVK